MEDKIIKRRPPRDHFNTKLKCLRLQRNLTQKQVSDDTGINLRVLQHYEQGSHPIDNANIKVLLSLCKALDCQLIDILEDPEICHMLQEISVP